MVFTPYVTVHNLTSNKVKTTALTIITRQRKNGATRKAIALTSKELNMPMNALPAKTPSTSRSEISESNGK